MFRKFLTTVALCGLLTACGESDPGDAQSVEPVATEMTLVSGIDYTAMDQTIRPQDDFHEFVNGTWLRETEIPGERQSYSVGTLLAIKAEEQQRQIIEDSATSGAGEGTEAQKVGDLFASFMDEESLNAAGVALIQPTLDEIEAVEDHGQLATLMARMMVFGVTTPLDLSVFPDFGDSSRYVTYFSQAGLSLPDRDYYFNEGENFVKAREALPTYMATMLSLAGVADAEAVAARVYKLEEMLAGHHWTAEDSQDFSKIYNLTATADLASVSDQLQWTNLLEEMGIADQADYVIAQPSYFTGLGAMMQDVPVTDWQAYLTYHLADSAAPYLSEAFVNARFNYRGKLIGGLTEMPPRWKRGVRLVNGALGEAVGKIYVERHFPPEAKARMKELVANLRTAFHAGIGELGWMSEETKAASREKLAKFDVKIGYPDVWRDYSALEIKRDDLLGNVARATAFEYHRQIGRLGGPIDRTEWGMTPQTVNAYYNPTKNEIVFPAAILQAPYFNLEADDAANYGAIGAVIGHEISHGFDDQGSKFDGDGNMRNWWAESDAAEFAKRGENLVAQFEKFEALPGLYLNGTLTLGENIGDLSGLTIALKAYQMSLGGEAAPEIDGYTGLQRFFLGYAQAWRSKWRDELTARVVASDPHSPARFRVNGIVANMPEFYEAFDVKEGDGHYLAPEQRVKVW